MIHDTVEPALCTLFTDVGAISAQRQALLGNKDTELVRTTREELTEIERN